MKLLEWLIERRDRKLAKRFGGIQECPWCRQIAQSGPRPWSFRPWVRDMFLDVLTCGVCEGTSLWRFELGMFYIGALDPPKPSIPDSLDYDVSKATLIDRRGIPAQRI